LVDKIHILVDDIHIFGRYVHILCFLGFVTENALDAWKMLKIPLHKKCESSTKFRVFQVGREKLFLGKILVKIKKKNKNIENGEVFYRTQNWFYLVVQCCFFQ
jgi:hypothetical protein